MKAEQIENEIAKLVRQYYLVTKKESSIEKIPVSGKVYNEQELINLVKASLEGWWTEGHWTEEFEKKIRNFIGAKLSITVNSGSSANLVAFKTLTSLKLGERRIVSGDEVITVAAGFPTTVNPIVLSGAIPVFIDVEPETYNIDVSKLGSALSSKTKAVMVAHTLGNPFNLKEVKEFCNKNNLWLIEDNCDALGAEYDGRHTGTFGDLATVSFYPAHHITTGEGGIVFVNNPSLFKIARSIRDWGRDCWCATGHDNTCKRRFDWQLGNLPYGYDHKYIYSEIGYNLKMTDLNAAIGVAQIDKLPEFVQKRRDNFDYLYKGLEKFTDFFILPKATHNSNPSWFGFLITIKDDHIDRKDLMNFLNLNNIGTRLLFAGNITKQPYFVDYQIAYRIVGDLKNTDTIVNRTFWVGIYPGITKKMLDYVISKFEEYIDTL